MFTLNNLDISSVLKVLTLAGSLLVLVLACNPKKGDTTADQPMSQEALLEKGAKVYRAACMTCHQAEGQGIPGVHPPLVQTGWVTGSKERLIKIVIHGLEEKIRVHGEIYDAVMPPMGHLSDEEIATVLSYVRNSFGNQASNITVDEVSKVRAGESLGEKEEDFASTNPVNDYSKRKIRDGIVSRVGSHFKKGEILLDQVYLPKGFEINVFAANLQNPRSLALGPKGTVFVGTRRNEGDFIYAILDKDKDWKPDTVLQISKGLKWNPMGVAMRGNDLYIGEIDRILKFENIEDRLFDPPEPVLIFNYPPEKKHGDKYIRFGPDDKLYVPVGAPCNSCLEDNPIFASITRINPDGSGFEIFAHGVRNSRGYDWHPTTKELWFSDHGRDHLGDDSPPCEVNIAPKAGMHFGFPFCHGADISDPEFGAQRPCPGFEPTVHDLAAHAAPVSLKFYTGQMFPEEYHDQILVAEHGSWNREEKQGYRIMLLRLKGNEVIAYEPFAYGWLDHEKNDAWGRPVDILQMPDGSLLVSDDYAGVIYRISYSTTPS